MEKILLRLHVFEFILLIATLIGLFSWVRTETREDNRQLRSELVSVVEAIRQDVKDFHGRLCAIEEKVKEKK